MHDNVYRGELNTKDLENALKNRIKNITGEPKKLIGILDACTDDIGARANFGRGNPIGTENLAFDQFLMKYSNFQMNRHNQ